MKADDYAFHGRYKNRLDVADCVDVDVHADPVGDNAPYGIDERGLLVEKKLQTNQMNLFVWWQPRALAAVDC